MGTLCEVLMYLIPTCGYVNKIEVSRKPDFSSVSGFKCFILMARWFLYFPDNSVE